MAFYNKLIMISKKKKKVLKYTGRKEEREKEV